VSSYGRNTFTRGAPCLCLVRYPFTRLQQPRITAQRTFGAETAHDPALDTSGFPGHLTQTASIPKPRRTRRMALLVPPYLRRRRSSIRTFGTEGQHHSVGLFLHNKTHITRAASAFSLNHHCKTSSVDPKSCVAETDNPAGRGKMLPKTIFPNKPILMYLLRIINHTSLNMQAIYLI
jgi:hypothetical protein